MALLELDLKQKSKPDASMAAMYLGAVLVRSQLQNPDGLALSAHGLRELMEKLPRYLDVPVAQTAGLPGRVHELTKRWRKTQETCPPDHLEKRRAKFVAEAESLCAWFDEQHVPRERRAGEVIDRLDQRKVALPKAIKEIHADIWNECNRHFEGVSHHNASNLEEFDGYVEEFENFLLDRLRPRTYEDQGALKNIIAEGEAHA